MYTAARVAVPVLLVSLMFVMSPAFAVWIEDGVPVRVASTPAYDQVTVEDGTGGVILAWEDYRDGKCDLYAQRLDATGTPLWGSNDVAVCAANGGVDYLAIAPDGTGGAFLAWRDARSSGEFHVYVQRVNASGVPQWTTDGVPLCTAGTYQSFPTIVGDGTGGAIVAWTDGRGSDYDIFAQRVDASGIPQWMADGIPICTESGNQSSSKIITDGTTGAIIAWTDQRINSAVYAQRVDAVGDPLWEKNGIPLCLDTAGQYLPDIVPDGSGGAIVAWMDVRGGPLTEDIYAERINSAGVSQWNSYGVPVSRATEEQGEPYLTFDGTSVIVVWTDYRNGSDADVYAQRLNASGVVQWTLDGVGVCTEAESQFHPRLVSDGAGGAVFSWVDWRLGERGIYSQRTDVSGAPSWTTSGVPLCIQISSMEPTIVSDGLGGAFVAWQDARTGTTGVYAQWVDANGWVGYLPLRIQSVLDVPNDQGGKVRITIESPSWDDPGWLTHPITGYNVWQRVDDVALLAVLDERMAVDATAVQDREDIPVAKVSALSVASELPVVRWNERQFLRSKEMLQAVDFPPGTWELVGSFYACQQEEYVYRATTLADSTASALPYSVYMISAHTPLPSMWVASEPDSGYSVDNLPPEIPVNLVGSRSYTPEGLALDWDSNLENDLSHYAVYRGTSETFVPSAGNRIAIPTSSESFDDEWTWAAGYCYKVSATDIHDNESGFALLTPELVTGFEPPAPKTAYLRQNFPNPFNPTTTIAFGLEAFSSVSLSVYDVAGRLVRVLALGDRPAGHHTVEWDGNDDNGKAVSSGIYYYRLTTGAFSRTMKMALLR